MHNHTPVLQTAALLQAAPSLAQQAGSQAPLLGADMAGTGGGLQGDIQPVDCFSTAVLRASSVFTSSFYCNTNIVTFCTSEC